MNLYGVGGASPGVVLPRHESPRRVETERTPVATPRWPTAPAAAPGVLSPSGPALQSQAPSGTDPELWNVLSADERAFFARAAGIGPLTYSHMVQSGQPTTAVVLGGRIDVRA